MNAPRGTTPSDRTPFRGKVWRFGDNISTDYMSPGYSRLWPQSERLRHVLHINGDFAAGCGKGDLIVAGTNFGCGSARESAPRNLRDLGIACVVAESFGSIFFRNCVALGLPAVTCAGVSVFVENGELMAVDQNLTWIERERDGARLATEPLSPFMLELTLAGGLLAELRRLSASRSGGATV